jgi:branched-chain amino acid aminotransferase
MISDYIQANTNGRLHDAREPSISPLNRGFLYGDAIYEVWRTYHGVLFAWDEHWDRLAGSAKSLALALPWSKAHIFEEIRRTVAEYAKHGGSAGEVYVRLQITRGGGPIGLDPALADEPDFVLIVRRNQDLSEEQLRSGLRLSVARTLCRNDRRTLDPSWKTGNYLNNLLCLREARGRGADEVVITNLAGEITEAAVSNIHFVRDGVVLTPAMASGLLGGITRKLLIEQVAPAAGVPLREVRLKPAELPDMQECFLSSTTKDLVPVAAIDGDHFDVSQGSVTRRLKTAFAEYARVYAETRPELRLP